MGRIKKMLGRERWYRLISFGRFIPDEVYLRFAYRLRIGKRINLDNPVGFNEKIIWLKLNDRNPDYIRMVDKVTAKDYVKEIIGDDYTIPTYGVWNTVDEIDFYGLPNSFVLKCTHDSGGVVVCKNKDVFDFDKAKKKLNKSMKNNFYWISREWPYKNIKPRIIAEKYLGDDSIDDLIDIKLMCFNGKVKCSFVCSERYSKTGLRVTFFDNEWREMPFERHYKKSEKKIPKPEKYDEMVVLAERLAYDMTFARIDFYEVHGNIYFGEITLYPGGGFEEFQPPEWDDILGNMLEIN